MAELLTTTEMAEADQLAMAAGIPGIDLMEMAGRAVAKAVPFGGRVVVVAGLGNNGGDGFVAARYLAERGQSVRVCLVGDRGRLKGDAALAADRWLGPVEAATPGSISDCDLIVDALFGAGLDRKVEGLPRAMILAMNGAKIPVIAVDLPSGVNGTTGEIMGAAVNADVSVTFFRRKTGHILFPGRSCCGRVVVADIGIPAGVLATIKPSVFENNPQLWGGLFPVPAAAGHKYTRGHAVVVSGGLTSSGAARLAARGALRAGAGLVTIASPPDALEVNAAASLAVMVRQVDAAAGLAEFLNDKRRNVVVLGPGGGVGQAMRDQALAALASGASVVLDADALTSFAGKFAELAEAIAKAPDRVVMTPHSGEYDRLFNKIHELDNVKGKLEQARAAAQASRAIVALKGPDTVVAAPSGRASIAENAPPYLATAGSGDVLAGIIGGLLAQGMPAFEAASAAVWVHGEAALEFGPGLIAEDLSEALPAVYRRLFSDLARYRAK